MYGSKTVDIYDTVSKQWSVANLSEARFSLSAITSDNKVYFAGGSDKDKFYSQIDIYDTVNNNWSTSSLIELSNGISVVALGDFIYWGGANWTQNTGKAEIWNTKNGGVTISCLSYPRSHPTAVIKGENIVFFTSGNYGSFSATENRFDIYNTITNKWSVGSLNQAIAGASFINVDSVIYVGGGVMDQNTFTDKVYTLNW
jgi:N-acetylneuraminic acid mutarotase